MSDAEHSPLPWRTDPKVEHEAVLGPDGVMVADCAIFTVEEDRRANAALIVRAVNAHEELVQTLADLASDLDGAERDSPASMRDTILNCRAVVLAALAKARGERT